MPRIGRPLPLSWKPSARNPRNIGIPFPENLVSLVPVKCLVFDMDGTLVDSHELAYQAALEGLRAFYAARGREPVLPTREEVRALVGLPSLEYFARLVPPDLRGHAAEVRTWIATSEVRRIAEGEGRLFPGVAETLTELRKKWRLGLVSNCGRIYFDANRRHLLDGWFDAAFCLDDRPSKTENVRAALAKLGGTGGVMVGDRAADLEAGRASRLGTVGCAYGYGTRDELAGADVLISDFRELPGALGRFS